MERREVIIAVIDEARAIQKSIRERCGDERTYSMLALEVLRRQARHGLDLETQRMVDIVADEICAEIEDAPARKPFAPSVRA